MTGYPNHNYEAFDRIRDVLEYDWEVVSPVDMNRDVGFDPNKNYVTPEFIQDAIRRDIEAILEVDALYALNGWENSKGATAEVAIAKWRDIPVFYETPKTTK